MKRTLIALAKNIDPRQPVQSAQADMGRNFSRSSNVLYVIGPFYLIGFRLFYKMVLWTHN